MKVYKLRRSFFEEYANIIKGLVTLWKNAMHNFPASTVPIDDYTINLRKKSVMSPEKVVRKKSLVNYRSFKKDYDDERDKKVKSDKIKNRF